MVCEKCGTEAESITCQRCGEVIARLGSFCYLCGGEHTRGEMAPPQEEDGGADFADRVLCSDGTCIGVIDEKGVCKICKKPYVTESA